MREGAGGKKEAESEEGRGREQRGGGIREDRRKKMEVGKGRNREERGRSEDGGRR